MGPERSLNHLASNGWLDVLHAVRVDQGEWESAYWQPEQPEPPPIAATAGAAPPAGFKHLLLVIEESFSGEAWWDLEQRRKYAPQLAAIAKRHRLRTLIDSTFATPFNQNPLNFGIDLVMHSATKYLGGHNDLLAGVIVGRAPLIAALREAQGVLGGITDPNAAYLLIRGLKTFALRMQQHNANGMALATFLEQHPRVRRVYYPGLPSHPCHAVAKRQMRGFGGVVSFEIDGSLEQTSAFIDALRLPYIAPSLGGVESLVEQPALMSYYELTPDERRVLGIADSLVRYAAGVEDTDDLIADAGQALAACC